MIHRFGKSVLLRVLGLPLIAINILLRVQLFLELQSYRIIQLRIIMTLLTLHTMLLERLCLYSVLLLVDVFGKRRLRQLAIRALI